MRRNPIKLKNHNDGMPNTPEHIDRERILAHLLTGAPLTGLEAFQNYHTLSLPQHVNALRNRGYKIKTKMYDNKRTGKRYAIYYIASEDLK